MSDALIHIDSVSKSFEARRVLKRVSLEVKPNQSVLICGVNGVGKSTLLRIAAGLLQPDEGSVLICGHCIKKEPGKAKPALGLISHKSTVYSDLTVLENLMFFARLYGVAKPAERIEQLVESLGLGGYRYDKAGILSRGLLQRVSIARSLIHEPRILLADEPFTGLDSKTCQQLVSVLKGFAGGDKAFMMTTHDTGLGLRCCNRVVVLHQGGIRLDVPVEGIDAQAFVEDYLAYAGGDA